MDFFGIGSLELVLILIVLLIAVGPAKLPEVAGAIGRGIRKFKQATMELSKDLKEMADEVKDVEKEVTTTLKPDKGLTEDLKEVAKEINDVGKEIKTTLDPTKGLTRDFKEVGEEVKDVGKEVGTALNPTPEKGDRDPGKGKQDIGRER